MVQTQQPLTVDLSIHTERESCRWTLAQLDAARSRGDSEVDRLVTQILVSNDQGIWRGTAVYNHLLELADKLVDTPEIILLKSSEVMQQLQWYPDDFVAYFEPMPVPDWVDTAQLQRASELWRENLLAIIGVLYTASLPACYLMHRGIPALYETTKLKDPRYISQRLYETGIFLEDVLSPGGIQVMTDIAAVSQHAVRSGIRLRPSRQRYFFGKGYVSAKKVRFLHASMRLMLTCPHDGTENHRHQALCPWDQAANGQPVNQEDLAFTLLTFGYLIPRGLAKWGCHWATEDQEAFWHLWRVVGYIMGIDATLIPQTWAEAEQLFLMIRRQQAGASTQGHSLTASLIDFFQTYLPPGLSTMISPMLIQHQLGSPYDAMVLPPSQLQETRRLAPRLIFALLLGLLHLYYLIRNHIFHRFPTLAAFMGSVFAQAGEALVQSWRDVYDRRPFEVPPDATDWRPMAGVREEDLLKLTAWRRQLFITIALGLSLLIGSSLGLGLLILLWLFDAGSVTEVVKWLTVGGVTAAMGVLKLAVPWVSRHRPRLSP